MSESPSYDGRSFKSHKNPLGQTYAHRSGSAEGMEEPGADTDGEDIGAQANAEHVDETSSRGGRGGGTGPSTAEADDDHENEAQSAKEAVIKSLSNLRDRLSIVDKDKVYSQAAKAQGGEFAALKYWIDKFDTLEDDGDLAEALFESVASDPKAVTKDPTIVWKSIIGGIQQMLNVEDNLDDEFYKDLGDYEAEDTVSEAQAKAGNLLGQLRNVKSALDTAIKASTDTNRQSVMAHIQEQYAYLDSLSDTQALEQFYSTTHDRQKDGAAIDGEQRWSQVADNLGEIIEVVRQAMRSSESQQPESEQTGVKGEVGKLQDFVFNFVRDATEADWQRLKDKGVMTDALIAQWKALADQIRANGIDAVRKDFFAKQKSLLEGAGVAADDEAVWQASQQDWQNLKERFGRYVEVLNGDSSERAGSVEGLEKRKAKAVQVLQGAGLSMDEIDQLFSRMSPDSLAGKEEAFLIALSEAVIKYRAEQGNASSKLMYELLNMEGEIAVQFVRRKLANLPEDSAEALKIFDALSNGLMNRELLGKADLPEQEVLMAEIYAKSMPIIKGLLLNSSAEDAEAFKDVSDEIFLDCLTEVGREMSEAGSFAYQNFVEALRSKLRDKLSNPPEKVNSEPKALTPEDFRTIKAGEQEVRSSDEQWNNLDFKRRVVASQLKSMLRRANDSQLDSGLLRGLRDASQRDSDPEDFWRLLNETLSQTNPPETNSISLMMGLINGLSRAGVSVSEAPSGTTEPNETQKQEAVAAGVEDIEREQEILANEMNILWSHLTTSEKKGALNWDKPRVYLVDHGNLNGYLDARRKDEANRQANKPFNRNAGSQRQAETIKTELEQSRQLLLEIINRRNPGLAGRLLLEAEISERAAGKFNGRWGQSERPTGEVVLRPEEAKGVAELNDEAATVILKKQSTPAMQAEMKTLLDGIKGASELGSANEQVAALQKLLESHKHGREEYERILNDQVVSRDRYRLGDSIVLELVRDIRGKTAFGIANAKFDMVAGDTLTVNNGLIERQNMAELDGANLLQDKLGFGDSLRVFIQTNNEDQPDKGGTAYQIYKDSKGQWKIMGTDITGQKAALIDQALSEAQVSALKLKRGGFVSILPGQTPVHIESFSLVYSNSNTMAKNKNTVAELSSARKPLGVKQTNIGAIIKEQYSKLPRITRMKRSAVSFMREG